MSTPELWLGTALWGWGVQKNDAFALLDLFAASGGVWIDTATNYPINGKSADFGAAGAILAEWLAANPGTPLSVLCKIGALDNSGGPSSMLDGSAVMLAHEFLMQRFGTALGGVSVHWDNRDDVEAIARTVDHLRNLDNGTLRLGLSGIRHPEHYLAAAPDLADRWWIQVKDNIQTRAAYDRYAAYFPSAHYIAYGINMGGVKSSGVNAEDSSLNLRGLDEPAIAARLRAGLAELDVGREEYPRDLPDLALIRAATASRMSGCILGARTLSQLERSLACWTWTRQAPAEALAPSLRLIEDAAPGEIATP